MEIAKLGEFGLIDHLTKDIQPKNPSTIKGVGDDCAVLHFADTETLVTSVHSPSGLNAGGSAGLYTNVFSPDPKGTTISSVFSE